MSRFAKAQAAHDAQEHPDYRQPAEKTDREIAFEQSGTIIRQQDEIETEWQFRRALEQENERLHAEIRRLTAELAERRAGR